MSENTIDGGCLCGAVTYEADPPFPVFQHCHCSRCRRFTGAAHASNLFCPPTQFRWTKGEANVGRYSLPDTKFFATAFCKTCGSSLPWTNQKGTMVIIPAGGLQESPPLAIQQSIHWASRPAWYVAPTDLERFDTIPPRTAR